MYQSQLEELGLLREEEAITDEEYFTSKIERLQEQKDTELKLLNTACDQDKISEAEYRKALKELNTKFDREERKQKLQKLKFDKDIATERLSAAKEN